ncbi:hypothetical protein OBV_44230 [Oscillibacter valericigenes Sjm18-20]|nr:hypothetical protein OBV_44230 [Oscillibacter valericigenes Sjm18-20]
MGLNPKRRFVYRLGALDKRYKKPLLETGILLKKAMGLYTVAGFHVIENYGQSINKTEAVLYGEGFGFPVMRFFENE